MAKVTLVPRSVNVTGKRDKAGHGGTTIHNVMIIYTVLFYTTLPHNLIKEKLLDLIEWTFKRALKNYGSLYLACNDRKAFFTSSDQS